MKSFNETSLAGMVCRDPELKFTPTGTAVCSWSMATNRKRKEKEHTTWWKVVCFGKTAELAGEYLKKGSNVYVTGEAEIEEYTDREGAKRSSLVLNVNSMKFLDSKAEASAVPRSAPPVSVPVEVPDESIPF